ncbi:DUF6364 family protein [Sulfitobacter sp. D35]|uniref:DUF6364 family protein n=1 Tax=Sulfitobacter sp. D35 TaxID=3083252 RepID=UPI00296FE589|nr:DUF6364 family protein [Sulfitobacter sp. D35]MDW4498311.1 DUF6364 family protein [Sulfitobacter sp. D35]
MDTQTVTLKLPSSLVHAAKSIASQRNETIAKVVEDLLKRDLAGRATPKTSHHGNTRLVFALQTLLVSELDAATGWEDLSHRLARHGYWLKLSWGGLTLHTETSGRLLCLVTDLGFGYRTFLRRFGPGAPVHPHDLESDAALLPAALLAPDTAPLSASESAA